jgi:type II secretory pathway pseudopilin PulG
VICARRETKSLTRRRAGLSIIELMISLAICALLLTAVAAAYSASASAIEINDRFFRASQAARVSTNQIMAQVRRCQAVTINPTSLVMTTSTGEDRTYAYNSSSKKLTLTLTKLAPPPTYTLASNVSSVAFTTDGKSVAMSITVQVGEDQVLLSGCATPRRTVTYQ